MGWYEQQVSSESPNHSSSYFFFRLSLAFLEGEMAEPKKVARSTNSSVSQNPKFIWNDLKLPITHFVSYFYFLCILTPSWNTHHPTTKSFVYMFCSFACLLVSRWQMFCFYLGCMYFILLIIIRCHLCLFFLQKIWE